MRNCSYNNISLNFANQSNYKCLNNSIKNYIDHFQPSAVSKVCFGVAILAMGSHCIFVTCIRNIRYLYGSFILTNFYIMMISYISFLTSCSITISHKELETAILDKRSIMELVSQFGFISSIYWNLGSSCQLCLVVYRGYYVTVRHYVMDFIQYLWGVLLAFILPGSCVYLKFRFDKSSNIHSDIYDRWKHEIECSLSSSHNNYLFFFLPILFGSILTIILLVLVALMTKDESREDRIFIYQNQEINARYGMCCKLTVTYSLIWVTGAGATYLNSPTLWHVFTLCCSLQTIFILVNFIFSRPVLDLLYRWRLELPSSYYQQHHLQQNQRQRLRHRYNSGEKVSNEEEEEEEEDQFEVKTDNCDDDAVIRECSSEKRCSNRVV